MRVTRTLNLGFIFLLALWGGGCSTRVEVNEPGREVYVVYGVLNPQLTTNYVRVARGFVTGNDVFAYAAQNDPSIRNADVRLVEENRGTIIPLSPVDTIRQSGNFISSLRVYGTNTPLLPGYRYRIEVRVVDTVNGIPESRLVATARTTIPATPAFNSIDRSLSGSNTGADPEWPAGNIPAYQAIRFDQSFSNRFHYWEVAPPIGQPPVPDSLRKRGLSYESRLYFRVGYLGPGGVGDTIWLPNLRYGPSPLFSQELRPCNPFQNRGDLCFNYAPFELIGYLNQQYQAAGVANNRVYDSRFLSQAVRAEITAVDTFLTRYLQANSLSFTDFTTIRPEYTNITQIDRQGIRTPGAGVFGSINLLSRYIRLGLCTQHLVGLNGTASPSTSCRLPN